MVVCLLTLEVRCKIHFWLIWCNPVIKIYQKLQCKTFYVTFLWSIVYIVFNMLTYDKCACIITGQ